MVLFTIATFWTADPQDFFILYLLKHCVPLAATSLLSLPPQPLETPFYPLLL